MGETWLFRDPPDLAVVTTTQILDGGQPILLVSHELDDGGWQFLDGGIPEMEDVRVVSLYRILMLDPTIRSVASLSQGEQAWRKSLSEPWQ